MDLPPQLVQATCSYRAAEGRKDGQEETYAWRSECGGLRTGQALAPDVPPPAGPGTAISNLSRAWVGKAPAEC